MNSTEDISPYAERASTVEKKSFTLTVDYGAHFVSARYNM